MAFLSRPAAQAGEFGAIARHALTVLAGQMAVMAFGLTDTIVAGRYSDASLAALSIGSAVYVSIYVALTGVIQSLLPVWAQQHGGQQREALGRSVRQSVYLWLLASLFGVLLLLAPGPLLRVMQVPMPMQAEVGAYLRILAAALPFALMFRIYGTLNQSLGRPVLVTWLQLASLVVKLPLSVWLALGGGPVPAMGAVGCAWATLIVYMLMAGVSLALLRWQPLYREYGLWRRIEPPHGPTLAAFARLGVPAGLSYLVDVTSLTLMALFIARQGTVPTAAHQIAASMVGMLYMVPLSLAIATSARVGYWLGAVQPERARQAVGTGMKTTACLAVGLAGVLFFARGAIAGLYTGNPAVAALAASLLGWVAFFHLGDAIQCFCAFVLRCWRITVSTFVVYALMLWGVGLGGGYALAYTGLFGPARQSPQAFWMAGGSALWLTALAFSTMLALTLRRRA
ncbi:MATE family efflux transporter [Xylophilus rhododendri]|uniref:MATE family efflux transporter n=1 Tax=Xylophilus rhododendri TaxID=2697032 RepID=A0A857J1X2_9BURK|nr:MATE family efflux transporter [Xylophilus rhododendri]QHI96948.1 MATE family efflux transporter [Xylophilus rhododendri]